MPPGHRSRHNGGVEIPDHIDALRRQGGLLAAAANGPAWAPPSLLARPGGFKDLLRHTGYIHRWAARHIIECPEAALDGPSEEGILRAGATHDELLSWSAPAMPGWSRPWPRPIPPWPSPPP